MQLVVPYYFRLAYAGKPVTTRYCPYFVFRPIKTLLFLIVFCTCQLRLLQAGAETSAGSQPSDFVALEQRRSEAIAKHDRDFLTQLYADDFRGVTAIGYEVDKSKLMELFGRDNPQVKFKPEELSARVLGDSAVVTGRLIGRTSGGEVVYDSKYMHVYAKREGRWQLVAGEGTLVQGKAEPEKTEQELRTVEREWDDAVVHKNRDVLDRIIRGDFIYIDAAGREKSKRDLVAQIISPDLVIEPFSTEDVKVRVYGDAAVLTGRFTQRGQFKDKKFESSFRYTDIYVKQNGAWHAVSAQAALLSPNATELK